MANRGQGSCEILSTAQPRRELFCGVEGNCGERWLGGWNSFSITNIQTGGIWDGLTCMDIDVRNHAFTAASFGKINPLIHTKVIHYPCIIQLRYDYNRHVKSYLPSFCCNTCTIHPFGEVSLADDRATNHPIEGVILC